MLNLGQWLFDPAARRLLNGSADRRLSPKAAGVLSALAETPGQVWSREALLERVWPGATVGEEVLTHAVAEVRKALQDNSRRPRYLETVHKSGYRLIVGAQSVSVNEHRARAHLTTPQEGARSAFVFRDDDGETDLDLEVFASYHHACVLYELGGRSNIESAVELYEAALRKEPAFVPAHVGLAQALAFLDYVHPVDFPRAFSHCAAALALEPECADAYAVEGLLFAARGDFKRAKRSLRAALTLKPDSGSTIYVCARACMAALELAPAAIMLERSAALKPDESHNSVLAGKVRKLLGDYEGARANYAAASSYIEIRLAARPRDFRSLIGKARCLEELGRKEEAETALDLASAHPEPMHYHLAATLARAGRCRRALDVLEEAVELGWRHRSWLDRDSDFDALRGARRFGRIANSIR